VGNLSPLWNNIEKHVLMFNIQGDGNGRHNLPGAPELERVTAALAVLGFVIVLARVRQPEFAIVLVWWVVALLGGILTLAFEAPQSLRAADAMVPATIFAALP